MGLHGKLFDQTANLVKNSVLLVPLNRPEFLQRSSIVVSWTSTGSVMHTTHLQFQI